MESTTTTEMSSAQLDQFNELGFCVVPNLISADECEALLKISHTWEPFQRGDMLSVMNPHKTDSQFFGAFSNKNVVSCLKKIMGGNVSGIQSQLFYGPPGCAGYSKHQDNFFIQANPKFFVSVWTALEDTGPENGGLSVYPKSHLEPILEVSEVPPDRRGPGQDPNSDRVEAVMPKDKDYTELDLRIPKGSSVFIHANVVHASHNNKTTDRFRHVLLCTYIKMGEFFRAGNYAKREATPL